MEGLDTQAKTKREVGDYGHLLQMKRHHLKYVLIWLLASFVFYIIGVGQSYLERGFLTIAVICVLPTALYLVRFLILMPYKSLSSEKFEQLHALYTYEKGLYYDVLLVIDGKSVFIPVMSYEGPTVNVYTKEEAKELNLSELLSEHLKVPVVNHYTSWMPFLKDIHPTMAEDQNFREQLIQYVNR